MATISKKAIVKILTQLRGHLDIDGVVRVRQLDDDNVIEINFAERKYIGRVRMEWVGDRYTVYLTDKVEGKVVNSTYSHAKSAYLSIKTASDARKFVKWYILTTQLAAMVRKAS